MSKAHAKKFIDLLHTDDALRQKVHEAAEEIVKLAKKKKLSVTREEISAALKEHWLLNKGKDDDKECFIRFSEGPGF